MHSNINFIGVTPTDFVDGYITIGGFYDGFIHTGGILQQESMEKTLNATSNF